jgi:glycine/D-amino acid oxidase-like deaminating enzyme
MIKNERAVIADSLWTATANPLHSWPVLASDSKVDVVIVGGGITGLSAALHLAEAGRSVAILEAQTPGWGASGRNGGQVNPGLKESPDAIEVRFGADAGGRMVRTSGGAADLVFSLIDRHRISCDAQRTGWIRAAHNLAALNDLQAGAQEWRRRGTEVQILNSDEITQMIGTEAYCGGVLDPRGGNLHPLNYVLGLAEAATLVGVDIYANSPALRLEDDGGTYKITTPKGALRAHKVLLCTNAYTDGLVSPLSRTVVPVRSIQVATEPLSKNVRASILQGGQAVSDTRRLLLYYRLDAEGRFIMGGRGTYGDQGTRRHFEALRDITKKMFPQIGQAEWQHAWGGFVAMTADHYPHLNVVGEGIIAGLGYNGRGVAMATAMGKVMADWAMGAPKRDLEFPVTDAKPIVAHGLSKFGVAATVLKYKSMDWLGL